MNNPYNLGIGGANPYLQQSIDGTLGDMQKQYNLQAKPNIESSMAASGSFGNSGLAQMQNYSQQQLMDSMGKTSANMRAQDVGQQRNYDLGLRQNDLGFAGLDANIANSNFQNQLAGANFGMNAYNTLQNGNQMGLAAGTQIQNTPLEYQNQFSSQANAAGGLGGSSSQSMPGNAMAGAMGGFQLYNAFNQSRPPAITQGSNPNGYNGTFNNPSAYVP